MKQAFYVGKKSSKLKWIIIATVAIIVVAIGAFYVVKQKSSDNDNKDTVSSNTTNPEPDDVAKEIVIKIAMMGDMLAHDSVNAQAKTTDGYDYKPYFTAIKSLYTGSDIVFCNPETSVAGDAYGVTGYPAFNAPSAFARDLVDGAGCNVVSLASNHQNDKGQAGINQSLAVWKQQTLLAYNGMNSSADDQNKVAYFTVRGVKVAFVAFADFSNTKLSNSYGVNIYHDTALVQRLMSDARANADVVLVSAHWGTEDSSVVNADQRKTAQLLADSGATMVIGTGPHVTQPVVWLKSSDGRDVPVWYSIGNMLNSQLGIDGLTSGVAKGEIHITDGKATVKKLAFAPTFMSYEWSAADNAANRLLAPLGSAGAEIRSMFGSSRSAAERRTYLETALDAAKAGVTVEP
jgi:poly-gamma-glutamate synthesis protein (capsule biosynthesis protein)